MESPWLVPLLQHHVGSDDELNAGDVLDGEVVEESDESNNYTNEKAREPLDEYVLEHVDGVAAPPVLLEELVLQNLVVEAFNWADIGSDERDLRRVVQGASAVA